MPFRAALAASSLCCTTLFWYSAAFGDEVVMTNGDRLSGRIVQADQDRVLLETTYAGTIAIDRQQVRSLHRVPAPAGVETADAPVAARADEAAEAGRDAGFSGRVNVALSSEKGNSEQNEIDIDYEVGYRWGWHRLESIGALEFDTNAGEKTTDKWASYSRYSRHFPSRWYGAFWLGLKHDRFADLDLRTLAGPVLGYLAADDEKLTLSIEAGPLALEDDFDRQPDEDFVGLGWFLDYAQRVWQGRLEPYHRQFGYLATSGGNKRLWQSWTGLRVPLAGGFTGSAEFEFDYDSAPAVEAETTDTTLRFKLGYQW